MIGVQRVENTRTDLITSAKTEINDRFVDCQGLEEFLKMSLFLELDGQGFKVLGFFQEVLELIIFFLIVEIPQH